MTGHANEVSLKAALGSMLRHPLALVREWNWKAAAFSAVLRGCIFLLLNLRAGHARAARAMLVELVYAMVAAGLAGAATQRLRRAVPLRQTAAVVFLAIPVLLLAAQAAVHAAMGTPRMRAGLLASYLFASMATGFNWFAMGRGIFLTGSDQPFWQDLLLLPRLFQGMTQTRRRLPPADPAKL